MIDLSEIEEDVAKLDVKLPNEKKLRIGYRTKVYTSKYIAAMTGREVHDVLPELVCEWDLTWRPVVEVKVNSADDPHAEVRAEGAVSPYEKWADVGVVEKSNNGDGPQLYRRLRGPEPVPAPIEADWIGDNLGLKIGNIILRSITSDQFPNVK